MRSIDGEVVSKLRLEKKNAQQNCAAQNSCSTLCRKKYLPMRTRPARSRKKDLCVPQGLPGMPMASPSGELATQQTEKDIP